MKKNLSQKHGRSTLSMNTDCEYPSVQTDTHTEKGVCSKQLTVPCTTASWRQFDEHFVGIHQSSELRDATKIFHEHADELAAQSMSTNV